MKNLFIARYTLVYPGKVLHDLLNRLSNELTAPIPGCSYSPEIT
jgi:hypothetical protein